MEPVPEPAQPTRFPQSLVLAVAVILGTAALIVGTSGSTVDRVASMLSERAPDSTLVDSATVSRDLDRLRRRLDARRPSGAYLVVSSTDNRFALMRGADSLRAGLCSTGSYVHLTAGDGRSWLFATPRGQFRILDKRTNPVWSKPDWAFIEEGLPVPPAGSADRYERGVLGRFALSIGDGYLIHGTPYQRLLGLPVSHGCVRLGDKDLETIYQTLAVGSPVFLY